MPFLTISTGLTLANEPNKYKSNLVLTDIGGLGLDQNSDEFRCNVYRGVLHEMKTCWQEFPILRVQVEKFDEAEWKRFYAWFLKQRKDSSIAVHFQPEIYDITDDEFEVRAIPLKWLEQLEKDGIFEDCQKEYRVNENRLKADSAFLTKYKEKLEKRKALEAKAKAKEEKAEASA